MAVRVVNSSRLWDNRYIDFNRSAIFVAPKILTYSLIAIFFITIFRPVKLRPITHPFSASPATKLSSVAAVKAASTDSTQNLIEHKPVHNDLAAYVLHQLDKPPAPPVAKPNCAVEACVALTFDDGPRADSTPKILTILEQEQVKATFFVVGRYVPANASLVKRMATDGYDIGNHTWAHPNLKKLTTPQIQEQINLTQAAIVAAGAPAPILFRPPYMDLNDQVKAAINMPIILWNVDTRDWAEKDPARIAQAIEAQLRPGAILVLHDENTTAAAIEQVIQHQKGKYHFVTITELLPVNAMSRGVYR